MPTRQNFNASDAILALAQRAGQGQNRERRFNEGQALIQNAQARMAQTEALRLESRKLELQAQQARLGARTPTSTSRVGRSPLTRSVAEANAEFKAPVPPPGIQGQGTVSGGGTGFSIDRQGNLSGEENGQPLDVINNQAVEGRRGGLTRFTPPESQATPAQVAKQNFLDSIDLDESAKQSLQHVVSDPAVGIDRLIDLIRDTKRLNAPATQLGGLTQNQQAVFQERAIRNQVEDTQDQINAIEEALSDRKINPAGRSPEDLAKLGEGTPGFFGTNPDPEVQRLAQQLIQLRAQKDQLRNQQRSFVSELVGQGGQTPLSSEADQDPSQASMADILRAASGQ